MEADSPLVQMEEVEEQGWTPKLIRTFSIVVLTITLGAVVWVSYLPIVPTIDEEFEAAPIETSLSIALFTLCNGVLPLVWGPISDNYSRRQLVLWAFPLLVVATYLGAMARSMLFMALVRMLSAIPSSVFYVVGMGILSDVVPPKNRALAFGLMATFASLGPVIGFMSGFVSTYFGWRYVFLIVSVFSTATGLIVLFGLPETLKNAERKSLWHVARSTARRARNLDIVCLVFASAASNAIFLTLYSLTPFVLEEMHDFTDGETGIALLVVAMSRIPPGIIGGKIMDKLSTRMGLGALLLLPLGGSIIIAGCTVLYGFVAGWDWWAPLVFLTCISVVRSFFGSGVTAFNSKLDESQAAVSMALQISGEFAIGAVAQAIALTLVGYFPIFAVAVGYGIACFVVCFLFLVPMIRHWGEHPPQALEMDAA